MREVIHRFNEIGLACLDPQWAGGRPRLLGKLAAFLATTAGRAIRIGREALRCLLARRGITFQRTKTWKESTDPERDTKLDRIEHVLENFPDRTFAFDEFGPLGLRPTGGACWAGKGEPDRVAATYHHTHGVTYFHGCYSIGDDTLWGINHRHKGTTNSLTGLKSIRAARPDGAPIYIIPARLPALAQRQRPPPRRAGSSTPRTCPHHRERHPLERPPHHPNRSSLTPRRTYPVTALASAVGEQRPRRPHRLVAAPLQRAGRR